MEEKRPNEMEMAKEEDAQRKEEKKKGKDVKSFIKIFKIFKYP